MESPRIEAECKEGLPKAGCGRKKKSESAKRSERGFSFINGVHDVRYARIPDAHFTHDLFQILSWAILQGALGYYRAGSGENSLSFRDVPCF